MIAFILSIPLWIIVGIISIGTLNGSFYIYINKEEKLPGIWNVLICIYWIFIAFKIMTLTF